MTVLSAINILGILFLAGLAIMLLPDMFTSLPLFLGTILITVILYYGVALVYGLFALIRGAGKSTSDEGNEILAQNEVEQNLKVKQAIRETIDREFADEYPYYPDFSKIKRYIQAHRPNDNPNYGIELVSMRSNLIKMYIQIALDRENVSVATDAADLLNYIEESSKSLPTSAQKQLRSHKETV